MKNTESVQPYGSSTSIAGVHFSKPIIHYDAARGDQWAMTWANDDNQYTAYGDGTAFGYRGDGWKDEWTTYMGVSRISGPPESFEAQNIWGGHRPVSETGSLYVNRDPAPDNLKPGGGLVSVGGRLYLFSFCHYGAMDKCRLLVSDDYGETWESEGDIFDNEPGLSFSETNILQFGRDYSGVPEHLGDYVYVYSQRKNDQPLIRRKDVQSWEYTADKVNHDIILGRIPKDCITDRSSYEFYSGTHGNRPAWSRDIHDVQPVFSDKNGSNWLFNCVYNPGLRKYILVIKHAYNMNPRKGFLVSNGSGLGIFESDEPWGPWETAFYTGNISETIDKMELGISYTIPQKWISGDGKTMWMVFAGRPSNPFYSFNLVKLTVVTES